MSLPNSRATHRSTHILQAAEALNRQNLPTQSLAEARLFDEVWQSFEAHNETNPSETFGKIIIFQVLPLVIFKSVLKFVGRSYDTRRRIHMCHLK